MKDGVLRSVFCSALLPAMVPLSNEVHAQPAPAAEVAYTAILAHPEVIKTSRTSRPMTPAPLPSRSASRNSGAAV
jgi:hypothetical protein